MRPRHLAIWTLALAAGGMSAWSWYDQDRRHPESGQVPPAALEGGAASPDGPASHGLPPTSIVPSVDALLAAGDTLAAEGKNAEALERFREAERANPADLRVQRRLATTLAALGRRDEAIAALDRIVKERPDIATYDQFVELRRTVEATTSPAAVPAPASSPVAAPATPATPSGSSDTERATKVAIAARAAVLQLSKIQEIKDGSARQAALQLARNTLAPALAAFDIDNEEAWRAAAVIALATNDQELASYAYEAILRINPKAATEQAMLTTLAGLQNLGATNYVNDIRRNREAALDLLFKANGGDPDAMVALAIRLVGGWGIAADHRRSVELLEQAYDAESMPAREALGAAYSSKRGEDATKDRALFDQLVKRANAGDAKAMEWAGRMLLSGRGGVVKDETEAVRWFRKGAEAGNGMAMNNLGTMYSRGVGGLPIDEAEAVRWFRKGAEAGNSWAIYNLGINCRDGLGVAKNEVEAVKLFRKAAEAGNAGAMNHLGVMYELGLGGLAKDEAEAVNWCRKAAEAGDATAMTNLGWRYQEGHGGLPKDDAKAVEWYRKAAETGFGEAMSRLGNMYAMGVGMPRDFAEAVKWWRQAAEAGNSMSMNNLGAMYAEGRGGLPKDDARAVEWYRKAAETGVGLAMSNLGNMYAKGQGGLPKDANLASKWKEAGDRVDKGESFEKVLRELGLR